MIRDIPAMFVEDSKAAPERQLVAAVMIRALQDIADGKEHSKSAREWFESESAEPMSFRWSCHYLGLPAAKLRENLDGLAARTKDGRRCRKAAGPRYTMRDVLEMYDSGLSYFQIAARLGANANWLQKKIRAERGYARSYPRDLVRSYLEEGCTFEDIAAKLHGTHLGRYKWRVVSALKKAIA